MSSFMSLDLLAVKISFDLINLIDFLIEYVH